MECILIGGGGFAFELRCLLIEDGYDVIGAISKDPPIRAMKWLGTDETDIQEMGLTAGLAVFVAVGNTLVRKHIFNRLFKCGINPGTFISGRAYVSSEATLGEGSIVYPSATVHAGCQLGKGVLINSNASIGHECKAGSFVSFGPGSIIGGKVKLGSLTYVGANATILQNLSVTKGCVLGAGSVVVSDLKDVGTYVGVPARLKS